MVYTGKLLSVLRASTHAVRILFRQFVTTARCLVYKIRTDNPFLYSTQNLCVPYN